MAKTTRTQFYNTMRSFRIPGMADKAYSTFTTRYTDNDVSGRKYEIEKKGHKHTILRIEYNLHATLFPLTYIEITHERKQGKKTIVVRARGRNGMQFFKSLEVHTTSMLYWHLASFIVCVLDQESGLDFIPMFEKERKTRR
jgi:hypothetical protein